MVKTQQFVTVPPPVQLPDEAEPPNLSTLSGGGAHHIRAVSAENLNMPRGLLPPDGCAACHGPDARTAMAQCHCRELWITGGARQIPWRRALPDQLNLK